MTGRHEPADSKFGCDIVAHATTVERSPEGHAARSADAFSGDKPMTKWTLDAAHANVEFAIKHMMITTIRGRFLELDVEVDFDEQAPERSSVVARIATASITTNQERRDAHLRGTDFLDAEQYPEMLFRSTSISKVSNRD
jgi:polyisoprenoid-binding protein YceI